jgi:methionyl-tRNA formyltransferase
MGKLRLLFAGSPELAAPVLEALAAPAADWELAGVLTNPDTPKGRSGAAEPTPVGAAAERLNAAARAAGRPETAVLKPAKLDAAAREAVAALAPDLLVTVAYGRIFGPKFLALFPRGGINLHPSLLPRWRGATPIPAAILAGDRETGLSVQRLALAMDSGDILAQERWALDGRETTASLGARAAERGAVLVPAVVAAIAAGREKPVPQDEAGATFCSLIGKDDGLVDWRLDARAIDARVRAYTPWPQAFTESGGKVLYLAETAVYAGPAMGGAGAAGAAPPGTVLGIDKAAGILVQTGEGTLALGRLQFAGKKALDWRAFLNGARSFIGSRLGSGAPAGTAS